MRSAATVSSQRVVWVWMTNEYISTVLIEEGPIVSSETLMRLFFHIKV